MEVLLDELSYVSQVHGTYHELNTENKVKWYSSNVGYTFFDPIKTKVIIGSAESGVLVEDLTRGHFRWTQIISHITIKIFWLRDGFSGCMQRVKVQGVDLDTTDSKHLHGQNIGECPSEDEES